MRKISEIQEFLDIIKEVFIKKTFVKLTLSKVNKTEGKLINIYLVPVKIKSRLSLSFTYRFKDRDQVKNFEIDNAINQLKKLLGKVFYQAHLKTVSESHQLLLNKRGKSTLISNKSESNAPSLKHNNEKKYHIKTRNNKYLEMLGVCDKKGRVKDKQQNKFKQINRYIELMSSYLSKLDPTKTHHILDMGSGKGYLTFALFDYLTNTLKKKVKIVGVERRKHLVSLCMKIREACEFQELKFFNKDIRDFKSSEIDIIIALHACDTATDSAINYGIHSKANLIVCAPCCHKQVRNDMKKKSIFDSISKHGIFEERQAEILTDTLRILLMEQKGYKTKAFEFVSNEHTRKNVMLFGKKTNKKINNEEIQKEIDFLKNSFQIERLELEDLLNQS